MSYELPVQLIDKEKERKETKTQFTYEKWANIKNAPKEKPSKKRK